MVIKMKKFEQVKGERQLMYNGDEFNNVEELYNSFKNDGNILNSSFYDFETMVNNALDNFFDWSTSDFDGKCSCLEVIDGYYVDWIIEDKICVMAFAG
jgi:hypothetical protein